MADTALTNCHMERQRDLFPPPMLDRLGPCGVKIRRVLQSKTNPDEKITIFETKKFIDETQRLVKKYNHDVNAVSVLRYRDILSGLGLKQRDLPKAIGKKINLEHCIEKYCSQFEGDCIPSRTESDFCVKTIGVCDFSWRERHFAVVTSVCDSTRISSSQSECVCFVEDANYPIPSLIGEKGLFAKHDVPAGRVIGKYVGCGLTGEEEDAIWSAGLANKNVADRYAFSAPGDALVLDPFVASFVCEENSLENELNVCLFANDCRMDLTQAELSEQDREKLNAVFFWVWLFLFSTMQLTLLRKRKRF